jgi:regulator-associated protein of mTOR
MVASSDGVIKLYRNYDELPILVSAFKAATDLFPTKKGTLISEWNQFNGTFYISGSIPVIKAWDADEELCVQEIDAGGTSPVSCLNIDQSGNLIIAGFNDGTIKLLDRRQPPGVFETFNGSDGRVLSVKFSNRDYTEFCSGTTSGDVKIWDIRVKKPVLKVESIQGVFQEFEIHDQAPVMGCVVDEDVVTMNFEGRVLGRVISKEGFLNRQIVEKHGLAFHPKLLQLATPSATDITIYTQ